MFLLGLLCIGVGVGVFCHDLPVGKQLHSLLIEKPARLFSKLSWAKLVAGVALMVFFSAAMFIAFNMHDGVVVFMALPEVFAWMAAFDIATLLELSVAAAFAATSIRVGAVVRFVAARVGMAPAPKATRSTSIARERRSRPRRPDRSGSEDDSPGPAWGYALA